MLTAHEEDGERRDTSETFNAGAATRFRLSATYLVEAAAKSLSDGDI